MGVCLPIRPQWAVRAHPARTCTTAIMTPEGEIKQALHNICPEAKAWSRGSDVSALIDGAQHLEGEELAEYLRVVAQLAYDEGRRSK